LIYFYAYQFALFEYFGICQEKLFNRKMSTNIPQTLTSVGQVK